MATNFKNKRILITAGPTWVPIDSVRVISNIASGQTGILLAQKLQQQGAKVTLLLGPVGKIQLKPQIKVIRFQFFDQLKKILTEELKKKYGAVIHTAAVADYRPKKVFRQKVSSEKKSWQIDLVPTEKLIDLARIKAPEAKLVGFKFETAASSNTLTSEAKKLLRRCGADIVVANTFKNGRYCAYLVADKSTGALNSSRLQLVKALIRQIEGELICQS